MPPHSHPPRTGTFCSCKGLQWLGVWFLRQIVRGSRPRIVGFAAIVGLSLLFLTSYDAIHVHSGSASSQEDPVASHHCLLCLSAHLPLAVHVAPMLPGAAFSRAAAPIPDQPDSYDSAIAFSLYTRPPPQA